MSENEIHVGDIGTEFTFTLRDSGTAVDISAATVSSNLLLMKPTGTTTTLSAGFVTTGSDGAIIFTSTAATFEQMGTHKFQAIIQTTTQTFNSDIYKFTVFPNLS